MSHKLDQSVVRLGEYLESAESYLIETKEHLSAAMRESVEELEVKGKNALARLEAKRAQATSAQEKVLHFLERKKEALVAKFEDWRTDREIEKLEAAADSKEQHAVDAMIAAAYAMLEAEVAILDALKARKIATEVAG